MRIESTCIKRRTEKQSNLTIQVSNKVTGEAQTGKMHTETGKNIMQSVGKIKCPKCNKCFRFNSVFRRHLQKHLGLLGVFTCRKCMRGFTRKWEFDKHMKKHVKKNHFECPNCEKKYISESGLRGHMQKQHAGEHTYTCQFCQRGFIHLCNYKDHIVKHCDQVDLCHICGMTFESGNLALHTQSHTRNYKETCHICQKGFSKTTDLDSHMQRHTGTYRYRCNYCRKRFTRSYGFNRHLQMHLREEPQNQANSKYEFREKEYEKWEANIHKGMLEAEL